MVVLIKNPFKFKLGEVLKDVITGFRGVAMARSQYYTGCNHYGLCPQKFDKEEVDKWTWLDEKRLIVVGKKRIVFPGDKSGSKPSSGPCPNPPEM